MSSSTYNLRTEIVEVVKDFTSPGTCTLTLRITATSASGDNKVRFTGQIPVGDILYDQLVEAWVRVESALSVLTEEDRSCSTSICCSGGRSESSASQ